jgi:hypothetical protein
MMPKAAASRLLIGATTLVSLAPCFGQQVSLKFGYGPQKPMLDVLSKAHVSGSLVYSGACKPHSSQNASVPYVHAPREIGSPVEILQDMFAENPKMRVTQNPDGIVRMAEMGVPTDILEVRIRHIVFEDQNIDSSLGRLSFRGPNMVMMTILGSPEVKAFEEAHNIELTGFRTPGNAVDSGLPLVSGELNDVTVSQAFDYILKTFPGFWVYENCSFEDGSRSVHFWFY